MALYWIKVVSMLGVGLFMLWFALYYLDDKCPPTGLAPVT